VVWGENVVWGEAYNVVWGEGKNVVWGEHSIVDALGLDSVLAQ
jgi:hypothetical protein